LDADDVLRADLIQHLMCQGEINIQDIENRYDIHFASYFSDAIAQLPALEADGLVTVNANWIKATERGRMLLRVIAMCFDRYLQNSAPVRFSKAI
ncbi:MAG: coproporphyrinogen III oxidase, partial [Xanthomonadales bacterium]|nr:coproporphyrinogen III oxidase [Xanthomonadales bacterium]